MFVAGMYSHNCGIESIEGGSPKIYQEILDVIENCTSVPAINHDCRFDLIKYQNCLKDDFKKRGWEHYEQIIPVDFTEFYTEKYVKKYGKKFLKTKKSVRQISLVKDRIGLNIEFERHYMVCHNINAQLTIFKKLGVIDKAVEIAPTMTLAECLDYEHNVLTFEHYIGDLTIRGTSNIDFPLVIIGIEE